MYTTRNYQKEVMIDLSEGKITSVIYNDVNKFVQIKLEGQNIYFEGIEIQKILNGFKFDEPEEMKGLVGLIVETLLQNNKIVGFRKLKI